MRLVMSFIGLACICAPAFGATLSVSVGFPSAPQAQGCGKSRADDMSASCSATLGDTQGTSLASVYTVGPNSYVILGMVHTTQPARSTTTVKSSTTITLDQFQNVSNIQGVKLSHNCTMDCEPVQVSANGMDVGTLSGGDCLTVPYSGTPLTITLFALESTTTAGTDYVGLFDISAVAY